jgi:hypothetical protein
MIDDIDRRLAANLDAVMGAVLAPQRSRFERALLAARVPERWARVMAATPALRWSWAVAVAVVLIVAASAGDNDWASDDRLSVMLALAPVLPVAAVAGSFGPTADRAYEVHLVTPLSGLRLLLLRTVTVLMAAIGLSGVAALVAPAGGGWLRVAWLAPSLATTACTLAVGAKWGVNRAGLAVTTAWLTTVVIAGQSFDDAVVAFRWPAQILAVIVTAGATLSTIAQRHLFDRWSGDQVGDA